MMKVIFLNMIAHVTRHHLRHLCSQKYEGYKWNKQFFKHGTVSYKYSNPLLCDSFKWKIMLYTWNIETF